MARALYGRAAPRKGAPRDGVCSPFTQNSKPCISKPKTKVFHAIMHGSLSSPCDKSRLYVSRYKKLAAVAEDAVAVRMDAGGGGGDTEMAQ
jgi:hypothetical protein